MKENKQALYRAREKRIMNAVAHVTEAKPENLKAMFEFTKEYGAY
jgi:hypothetical protein